MIKCIPIITVSSKSDKIIQFGYMTRLEMIELFGIKTGSLNISKTWTVVAFFYLDFDMP